MRLDRLPIAMLAERTTLRGEMVTFGASPTKRSLFVILTLGPAASTVRDRLAALTAGRLSATAGAELTLDAGAAWIAYAL
jgi:hypothetical protein